MPVTPGTTRLDCTAAERTASATIHRFLDGSTAVSVGLISVTVARDGLIHLPGRHVEPARVPDLVAAIAAATEVAAAIIDERGAGVQTWPGLRNSAGEVVMPPVVPLPPAGPSPELLTRARAVRALRAGKP